ncbi:MAG: hypothetical protein LBT97_03860 [Planctomycetota bacterium]|jgi:hypothetical protein|nr:hypothetical protein [Planctomycetota bacterium]
MSGLFGGGGLFGFGTMISMFGTGMSASAAYQEAAAQNAAAQYNAQIEDQNAAYYELMGEQALALGEKDAADLRRSIGLLKGEQRANYAQSGVKVDEGTPLEVAMDTSRWGEYDAQTIMYNAAIEKLGYDQKAYNSRASASMLRATKRSPSLAAAGVVLNGVTSVSQRYGGW